MMAIWAEDDGVREVHGVAKNDGEYLVTVKEVGNAIHLDPHQYGCVRSLTPKKARYLARQLNRLARRIESREPPSA